MGVKSFGPDDEAGADLPPTAGLVGTRKTGACMSSSNEGSSSVLKNWALVHHGCWPKSCTDKQLHHGVYIDSGCLVGWGQ